MSIYKRVLGIMVLMSILGSGVANSTTPVQVTVQSGILTTYGATTVVVPVYINNAGFDTIGGYRLTFNSSIPYMIDFRKSVDTVGTLTGGFSHISSTVEDDSILQAGDYIKVIGLANSSSYILPQESGVLLKLRLNISAACELISDTNIAIIYIAPFISEVSDSHGNLIPTAGQTSADTLILVNGSVEVPGQLIRGDVNGSCKGIAGCLPSLADAIYLVNHVFNKPGFRDLCPEEAADVNCSNTVSLADVIGIINRVIKNIPFPNCP